MATRELANPQTAFQRAAETSAFLLSSLPQELRFPRVAIVCGSGLGGLVDTIHSQPRREIAYSDIPNFPQSTVEGHEGKLVFGVMGSKSLPVILLVGRAHFYEGHTLDLVTFATRVCKVLGAEIMIVTNAAGGLNPDYAVGDIVILNDHLYLAGLTGFHPLRGPNESDFGIRFPPLSDAYDLDLRRRAHQAWVELGLDTQKRQLREGVYAYVAGPSYETRAECRMLRALGADLVGMSTVPEIVVARHSNMRVLAFSLVTNNAVLEPGPCGNDPEIQNLSQAELTEYLARGRANHLEVLQAGQDAAKSMQDLVKTIIKNLYN